MWSPYPENRKFFFSPFLLLSPLPIIAWKRKWAAYRISCHESKAPQIYTPEMKWLRRQASLEPGTVSIQAVRAFLLFAVAVLHSYSERSKPTPGGFFFLIFEELILIDLIYVLRRICQIPPRHRYLAALTRTNKRQRKLLSPHRPWKDAPNEKTEGRNMG